MKTVENKFLITFFVLSSILIMAIAFFNFAIDPYEYFESSIAPQFNKKKLIASNERFDCALKIMCHKPKGVLFGSSRLKTGYEASYYSQLTGVDAYKVSLSGARFNEIFSYFEHVLHNQADLEAVFISLDFFAFSKNIKLIQEYSEERLRHTKIILNDRFKLFLSWPTTKYSFHTLKYNYSREPVNHSYKIKIDNEYVDISEELINNPKDYLNREIQDVFQNYEIDPLKVEQFEKIVKICKKKNIDLKLIFSPANAVYWETLYQSGRWEDFENLKRALCHIAPIYDFSNFSVYNQESLASSMQDRDYYFEFSHFKPQLGRIIFDHIYGIKACANDSGYLLKPETIETVLEEERQQRDAWRSQNLNLVEWVSNLYQNSMD